MPIDLQVGKRYKLRNGHVTAPLQEEVWGDPDRYYTDERIDDFAPMWREGGRATFFNSAGDDHGGFDENENEIKTPGQSIYDIIEEVEDEA